MTGRRLLLWLRFDAQVLTETVMVRHGETTHLVAGRTVTPQLAVVQALSDSPYRGAVISGRFQLAQVADGRILTAPLCPGKLAQALLAAVAEHPGQAGADASPASSLQASEDGSADGARLLHQ